MHPLARASALGLAAAAFALPLSPAQAAPPTCHGYRPTIVGTNGDDVMDGTPGRDVVLGLDGDDTIRGLGGNDVLCGNDGGDRIAGGAGDDLVYGGYNGERRHGEYLYFTGDTISGGRGDDLLDLGDDHRHPGVTHIGDETLTYADSPTGVHLDLGENRATGEGHDRIVPLHLTTDQRLIILGSPHDDVIKGTGHRDMINPLQGGDDVFGRGGGDRIEEDGLIPPRPVPNGNDEFRGGPGNDTLDSGDGQDVLLGGKGRDSVQSFGSEATLYGGDGRDHLWGGGVSAVDPANRLYGGPAADRLTLLDPALGTVADGGPGLDHVFLSVLGTDALGVDLAGSVTSGATTYPVRNVESWRISSESTAIDLRGTRGRDVVQLFTVDRDAEVTASLSGGDDVLGVHRSNASVRVHLGGGDDRFHKGSPGAIAAWLGPGDDLVETTRGVGVIGDPAPARTYDGGPGTDTADLDLAIPNNTCTQIEKGNCPP